MIRLSGDSGPTHWRSPAFPAPSVTGSSSSNIVLNHNLNDEFVHITLLADHVSLGITSRYDFFEGDTASDFFGYDTNSFGNLNSSTIRVYNLGMAGQDIYFDVVSYA